MHSFVSGLFWSIVSLRLILLVCISSSFLSTARSRLLYKYTMMYVSILLWLPFEVIMNQNAKHTLAYLFLWYSLLILFQKYVYLLGCAKS